MADVFVVWARSDDHGDKIRGLLCWKRGMTGLSAPKIDGKLSLRASTTGEIVMEGVEVPDDALLPNVEGLKGPFGCLNRARYGIAWGVMGGGRVLLDGGPPVRAGSQPIRGGRWRKPQLFQKKLADMQTDIALGLQGAVRLGADDGGWHRQPRAYQPDETQQLW